MNYKSKVDKPDKSDVSKLNCTINNRYVKIIIMPIIYCMKIFLMKTLSLQTIEISLENNFKLFSKC